MSRVQSLDRESGKLKIRKLTIEELSPEQFCDENRIAYFWFYSSQFFISRHRWQKGAVSPALCLNA